VADWLQMDSYSQLELFFQLPSAQQAGANMADSYRKTDKSE